LAFEKSGTLRADPSEHVTHSIGSRCKRSRTAFASQSVLVSLSINPPRAGLEAGRWVEKHSNGPNLLAHYFYL